MKFIAHIPWYCEVTLVFLVMITVLVAAHEYGHYLFARLFGMGVEEFALGMGKRVAVWRRKSYKVDPPLEVQPSSDSSGDLTRAQQSTETTEFTLRALPVGGFVRIKGMVPEDDGSEINIPGGFYSKAPWKRFIVLLAGPTFSVLAGLALLVPVFSIFGIDKPSHKPILGPLAQKGAATAAGLKEGDRIVAIDGHSISDYYDITRIVTPSDGQHSLLFLVQRGDKKVTAKVTPLVTEGPVLGPDLELTGKTAKLGRLGAQLVFARQTVSISEAWQEAVSYPLKAASGLFGMFVKPSTFSDNVGGPATMVDVVAHSTEKGIDSILVVAALLSISVGIMNLLPVPPLDGGQMLVALAEMLRRGRRLSIRVQTTVANLGAACVLALIVSVLFVDFRRYALPEKPQAMAPAPSAPATATPR